MRRKKKNSHYRMYLSAGILILIVTMILTMCIGRYYVAPKDVVNVLLARIFPLEHNWADNAENVVLTLRLPRVTGAVLVGGALALSGAAYQGIFQNPLVSPDILGVTGGASVGAAGAILLGLGSWGIQGMAFCAGILAVTATNVIPRMIGNRSKMMLVLSGVIVSGIASSLMGILIYVADPNSELPAITYWQLGSLQKVVPRTVCIALPVILICTGILLAIRWKINVLSMGEMEVRSLGISTGALRNTAVVCATLLTASAVCVCGNISWVGLVIPHFSRMLVGPDNGKLLPMSFVMGAVFMLVIDTIARSLTGNEIPLGILTGLIGAPFYFYLLKKQGMNTT